ncbi:hypothetical protein AAZX31_14G085800 [Glycine max]|nr:hypothetical protein JHK84_039614 [Glycine max]
MCLVGFVQLHLIFNGREREFHSQLEENAKIFLPYINNFDFVGGARCIEIHGNVNSVWSSTSLLSMSWKITCSSWSNGNIDFQCKQNSAKCSLCLLV